MVNNDKKLHQKLFMLKEAHRQLDDKITTLQIPGSFDYLKVKRLKKQKLVLKSQIVELENILYPDIIA